MYAVLCLCSLFGARKFELHRREQKVKIRESELRVLAVEAQAKALEVENARKEIELQKADGSGEFLECIGCTLIGMMDNLEFDVKRTSFRAGDTLFLCTDGVTEAMNSEKEVLSEARLLQHLRASKEMPLAGPRTTRLICGHGIFRAHSAVG